MIIVAAGLVSAPAVVSAHPRSGWTMHHDGQYRGHHYGYGSYGYAGAYAVDPYYASYGYGGYPLYAYPYARPSVFIGLNGYGHRQGRYGGGHGHGGYEHGGHGYGVHGHGGHWGDRY